AHLSPHRIQAARDLSSISIGAQPYVEEALRWTPDEPSRRSEENPGNRIGSDNRTDCLPVIATAPAHGPPIRGRILLADDNADMRDYVCRLLGPHYEVEAVPDGEAALATARQSRFDLVLTDVMMPRLDGFALLRELRGHPDTKTIPVILLSARAGEESRLEGLEAGADDYLIKPFTSRELLGRVDAHLRLARMRRE